MFKIGEFSKLTQVAVPTLRYYDQIGAVLTEGLTLDEMRGMLRLRRSQISQELAALVRAILPSHSAVGGLFGEVYESLGAHAPEALGSHPGEAGQTLVLQYDNEHRERDVDGAAAFILNCRVPERDRMRVFELPAATMAATVHHGTYNTIAEAHEAVLTWTEANGYRIVGPDREVYLFNKMPIRQDDPSYVTEIQYPVEKRGQS